MDPEKVKTTATTTLTTATATVTTNSVKSAMKIQSRHQEHNYTNTSKSGEGYHRDEGSVSKTTSSTTMTTAPSSSSSSSSSSTSTTVVASSSDSTTESRRAGYSGTRSGGRLSSTSQSAQPTSTLSGDRHTYEVRRVIKKDVFNRIRRSEEELQKAAEMVRGGMTFQTASDTFKIPISTIRFYMARRGILPQRRRGRGSSGVRDDDLMHPPFEIIHYRLPDIDRPI